MHSFVTNEFLQSARRSAKRKRAASACSSCKEKKSKCSGFSPCARCVNNAAAANCIFQNKTKLHHLDSISSSSLEDASAPVGNHFKASTFDVQPPLHEMRQPRSYRQHPTDRRIQEDLGNQLVAQSLASLREGASNRTHEISGQPLQISFPFFPLRPSKGATAVSHSVFANADETNPVAIEVSRNPQPFFTYYLDQSRSHRPRVPTQSSVGVRPIYLAYDTPNQLSPFQPSVQQGYVEAITKAWCKVAAHASEDHARNVFVGHRAYSADAHFIEGSALPTGGKSRGSVVEAWSGPGAREVLRAMEGSVDDRDRGCVIGGGWTCPPRAWLESSLGGRGETRTHP